MWLTFAVAVGLSGYRWGYHAGTAKMAKYRQQVGIPYAKAYNVADLVEPAPPEGPQRVFAGELIRDICRDVLPRTWTKSGGTATIAGYSQKNMVIVNHDQRGHDHIAAYLQLRRRSRP